MGEQDGSRGRRGRPCYVNGSWKRTTFAVLAVGCGRRATRSQ